MKSMKSMKRKIFTVLVILTILALPSFNVFAISAFADDFNSYQTGMSQTEVSAALKARGWSIDDGKLSPATGQIDIISCPDISGKASLALQLTSLAGDPYMQVGGIDYTGERILSFDIKPLKFGSNIDIMLTSVWLSILRITPDRTLTVLGKPITALNADEWYNIVIKSSYNSGQFTFSVYLNGALQTENAAYSYTIGASQIMRLGVGASSSTSEVSAIIDNFSLKETSSLNFNGLSSAPANNAENVAITASGLNINFGTIIKNNTLNLSAVTASKSKNGAVTPVACAATLNPWSNGVDIAFSGTLEYETRYTVTLPSGITDIAGNIIPSNKTTFSFLTYEEPAGPQPDPMPEAAISSPKGGEEFDISNPVPLTAAAVNQNGAPIIKVEFYVNNKYAGEALSAPFTYYYTAENVGEYTVKARAYDTRGAGDFSPVIRFNVTKRNYVKTAAYNFEDYTGGNISGAVAVANSGTFSPAKLDSTHGTSLKISVSGSTTSGGGPYISFNFAPASKGILVAECDIRITNPAQQILMFGIKSTQSQWSGDFNFENGQVVRTPSLTPLMSFSADRWYKVRQVYNLDSKKIDIYVDDVCLVSNQSIQNPLIDDIPGLRITFNSQIEAAGAVYVDNMVISRVAEPLKLSTLIFRNESGAEITSKNAANIKTISVKGNKSAAAADINAQTVILSKNGAKCDISVKYNGNSDEIVITPKNPLKTGELYVITVKGSVRDTDGEKLGNDANLSFYTEAADLGAVSLRFFNNSKPVASVLDLNGGTLYVDGEVKNQTAVSREVSLILAKYKDGALESYKIKTVTIPAGQTVNLRTSDLIINDTDINECEFISYLWEGTRNAVSGQISLGK